MKTYQAKLTIKETHVDSVYGRVFEAWMSGEGLSIFGSLAHTHCAMTSGQAIAHKVAVEKRAFEFSQAAKISSDGETVEAKAEVEIEVIEL